MSYNVRSKIRAGNEQKKTSTLLSLCQNHAIVLVALIESAAVIALGVLQAMTITSPKDQSKMIRPNQSKI